MPSPPLHICFIRCADDNRLLTLPNGERIRLQPYCKIIIEVADLQYASPATISRCGMTYVDPKNLGYRPFFVRWLKQRCSSAGTTDALGSAGNGLLKGANGGGAATAAASGSSSGTNAAAAALSAQNRALEAAALMELYDQFVPKLISYILDGEASFLGQQSASDGSTSSGSGDASREGPVLEAPLTLATPLSGLSLVKQLCAMLDATLPPPGFSGSGVYFGGIVATAADAAAVAAAVTADASHTGSTDASAAAVVAAAAVSSVPIDRELLEGHFVFSLTWGLGGAVTSAQRPRVSAALHALATRLHGCKGDASLYDYYFDASSRRWEPWGAIVPAYTPPLPFEFHKVLVPTTDSVLYTALLARLVQLEKPVLLTGESGTAKSVTISGFLGALPPEGYSTLSINFSSRTSARDVQVNIESVVDKRSGKSYGPPPGKKLVVFVDDLHMPKVDKYGTQQPTALLHFLVGRGHMYDHSKDLELRTYKDMLYMGAMQPPGGGVAAVDPRFVSLFSVFNLTPPSVDVLTMIYGSIMSGYLGPFHESVHGLSDKITAATLSLYARVSDKLPATPAKFHYVFNLRDLGRVFQGVCSVTPDVVSSAPALVRLWRNEVTRVFSDRLICVEDVRVVGDLLTECIKRDFPDTAESALAEPLLFGSFADAANRLEESSGKEDARLYSDLGGISNVREVMERVLAAYNTSAASAGRAAAVASAGGGGGSGPTSKPMTLVLFETALEHVTRIHRILVMPRGHALLVGVGGSGKQSLTRLAAFAAGYALFEITLTRGYGEAEFRENLKELFRMLAAGPTVFLFTDAHVIEEGFLELVNNLVTSGMVPALFTPDERDAFIGTVRAEVRAAGLHDTKECCWNWFVSKCRDRLHVVLAMSPSGETLRRRCRAFPGIVSNTTIDWFFPWPADALRTVAETFLGEEALLPAESRAAVVSHMVHVHQSVVTASHRFESELRRHNYVTPKNYLDFIRNYREQLSHYQHVMSSRIKRLEGGLTKLSEAATAVDRMSADLQEQKIVVDAKTVDVKALIKDIGERQAVADRSRAEAVTKQRDLEVTGRVITEESAKASIALDAALPALEAAAAALDNLNKDDITEIRAFASPPPLVMIVCMAVMALRPTGKENESEGWKGAKMMMSDGSFLKSLKNYDKDRVNDKVGGGSGCCERVAGFIRSAHAYVRVYVYTCVYALGVYMTCTRICVFARAYSCCSMFAVTICCTLIARAHTQTNYNILTISLTHTTQMMKRVTAYFRENKDLNLEKMLTVSKAGAGLLQWVIAIRGE